MEGSEKAFWIPSLDKRRIQKVIIEYRWVNDGKNVFIDFGKNDLRRSLYTFVKFFQLAGYRVFVKPNNHLFAEMKTDPYSKWLIEEGAIQVCSKPKYVDYSFSLKPKKGFKLVTDRYFVEKESGDTYFLPITMHPVSYILNIWNVPVELNYAGRLQSIFIAGSFKESTYKRIEKQNLFDVVARFKVFDFVREKQYTFFPKSLDELDCLSDFKGLCIVNSDTFYIPLEILRSRLAKFSFFFALPGASVPLSHNVVEAMSVGCVPIIQRSYANLFYPTLENGVNALIFDDLESMDQVIHQSLEMDHKEVLTLMRNSKEYYDTVFDPNVVVSKLLNPMIDKIHIVSFSSSAKHLRSK